MAIVEPDWIDCSTLGGGFCVELDINAAPFSPEKYRHKRRVHTGEDDGEWAFGKPTTHEPGYATTGFDMRGSRLMSSSKHDANGKLIYSWKENMADVVEGMGDDDW